MSTTPHESSTELAARLHTNARVCEIVTTTRLSTSVLEVILAGDARQLVGVAGNDVMVRVASGDGRFVRRRYSVRDVDESLDHFSLWVTTEHDGPGSRWAATARHGDLVDVVGPRGKITLDPLADWHVFIGDPSGLAAFYRLAHSIEVPGRAIFIIEIDHLDDALTATFDDGLGVTGIFVDRQGRERSDPAGLLSGLAAFALPPDLGHAYLFGEFNVMKAVRIALLDRGIADDQISLKAYWRTGRGNAEHGEPDKSDS